MLRCDETHSGPHAAGGRAFRDFAAVGHREHRTRDRAACISAAVHDGGPRQSACATSAAMSVTEGAECSSDVPRVIAPGLLLSSELRLRGRAVASPAAGGARNAIDEEPG